MDAEFCQTIAKAQVDVEKMFETVCQGTCKPSTSHPFPAHPPLLPLKDHRLTSHVLYDAQ